MLHVVAKSEHVMTLHLPLLRKTEFHKSRIESEHVDGALPTVSVKTLLTENESALAGLVGIKNVMGVFKRTFQANAVGGPVILLNPIGFYYCIRELNF